MPYRLRQDAGPNSPLGRVEFMFPSRYSIDLHDTPKQGLSDRAERTFSSGCIRVERPFELAERAPNEPEKWDQTRIRELVESNRRRTAHLAEPFLLVRFYWTAEADPPGRVEFRKDIDGRDPPVLAASSRPAAPPSPRPRETAAAWI